MPRTFLLPITAVCMLLFFVTLSAATETEAAASERDQNDPFYDPFTNEDATPDSVTLHDPLEGLNRAVFNFNDRLYFYALKPAAQGYAFVVPEPARMSIKRCFLNIATPERLVNCALQGKFKSAVIELWRFVVNTTVGVAGLFDPARALYSDNHGAEDSGQTMGSYGLKPGFYLVLPFFGPSDMRDALGLIIDSFLDPFMYLDVLTWERLCITGSRTVNNTSLRIGEYEDFKKAAVDPYISLRDGFAQHRAKQIGK